MTGRIKLLKNGEVTNAEDTPEIEYEYDQPSEFDLQCGTINLDAYQLPQSFCPDQFVCATESASENLKLYSRCIDAMNCAM